MNALVVGCGRLGAELAYRLYADGHDVSVIDVDKRAFANLNPEFRGKFEEGDALNQDVLKRAGIQEADSLAVVTPLDVLNAVVGYLAREIYQVPNVVVRNYSPRNRHIHEAYGLQVISALNWGAQRIQEMMYHSDMRAVFSAGNGEIEVYEITVPESCEGISVSDLMANEQCVPVAITRAGKAILPTPQSRVEAGDILHVSATAEGLEHLRDRILRRRNGRA